MISNKTVITLFLVILGMKTVTSTLSNIRGPSSSERPIFQVRKRRRVSGVRRTVPMLQDMDDAGNHVETRRTSTERVDNLQRRVSGKRKTAPVLEDATGTVNDVLPINNHVITQDFKCQHLVYSVATSMTEKCKNLIKEEKYWMTKCPRITINRDGLLNLTCSISKTFVHYKGQFSYLKRHGIVAFFYVYGDIELVKKVIFKSKVYGERLNVNFGNLEAALILALEKGHHDRVIELLNVRKGITAEQDERNKLEGWPTSFEYFMIDFLRDLAPWNDEMALKRFLTMRGDELRNKYPDILDTLCQRLVYVLKVRRKEPSTKKFLIDLIGQPFLLTPVTFTKGLLSPGDDTDRSFFIKYAWNKAIEEGMKKEYTWRGDYLWQAMTRKHPDRFTGNYPETEEARATVLSRFSTKQQKEEQWAKENVPDFSERLEALIIDVIPTKVLVKIIIEYANLKPTWLDIQNTKLL